MKKNYLLLIFLQILFCNFLFAQTWNGNTSTDWNTASNWTGGVPTATANVIIPGGLANYPVLATDLTINSIVMTAESKLDFKGHSLAITGVVSSNNLIKDATLNNSDGGSDIVINLKTGVDVGFRSFIVGTTVNDNITFNLSGTNAFGDSDGSGSPNTYAGNVTFNISDALVFKLSQSLGTQYGGDLTIHRTTIGGVSELFSEAGTVNGNFSFINQLDGNVIIGNTRRTTIINGKVDIAVTHATPARFDLFRILNQTTGGTIDVRNTLGFNVRNDTLKVISLNLTGYRGDTRGYFYNNDITGNLTISDDASFGGNLYYTRFWSNLITGNTDITINGSGNFNEADAVNTGNHFIGNVSYTVTGKANLSISSADASIYYGNLTIKRTASGRTAAFTGGGNVGGDFSFVNNSGGPASFGNVSKATRIRGKVDITIINDADAGSASGNFELFRLINQSSGGSIDVQNSVGFNVQQDTLRVKSLSITGYRGRAYGNFYNNNITGNLTIASDASHVSTFSTTVRSNNIIGNATFTKNSASNFFDADEINTGNTYSGDVVYNKNELGIMQIGYGDTTSFGRGFTLNSNEIYFSNVEFTGNSDGRIQQIGDFPVIIPTMIMKKTGTGKILLFSTLKINKSLNLISGNIIGGYNGSNLMFSPNTSCMGGSASSYVSGQVVKIGNQAFTFPVGANNKYGPIAISAPSKATDEFSGEYVDNNSRYDPMNKDADLDHISTTESWIINGKTGNSNVFVTLSWEDNRSGGVDDMAALRVARWDGSWKNLGNGTTTGTNAKGTIQTAEVSSRTGTFTLASATALNPLPINISKFDAIKYTQSVSLKWSTENEINFSHFEIERADSDNHFSSLGEVLANNEPSTQHYSFEDMQPLKGINLYRLKLLDRDGKMMYSKVISVAFNEKGMITIYPNPATEYILIDGVQEGISIEINDASGKLVKRMLSNVSNRYSVKDLRKGMYFIKILDKENTRVSKLIIQ